MPQTKKRDYKAEYKRRIERGLAKGLSRSQSRGHPKAKEKYIKKAKPIPDDVMQVSLKSLRSGQSLTEVAKEMRISPERLRNQAKAKGAIRKSKGRWTVLKKLPREMLVYSQGKSAVITVDHMRQASKVGRYMSAVGRFTTSNDVSKLTPFKKKSAKDIKGDVYPFETDPNTLYRLVSTGAEPFEQVYKIVI